MLLEHTVTSVQGGAYVSLFLARGRVMARCCSVPPTESRVYQSTWHPARGRAPLDHLDRESFDRLKSWLALRRSRSNWAGDSIEAAMVSRLTEVSIFVIGKQVSNRFTLWVKVTFAWLERASNIE